MENAAFRRSVRHVYVTPPAASWSAARRTNRSKDVTAVSSWRSRFVPGWPIAVSMRATIASKGFEDSRLTRSTLTGRIVVASSLGFHSALSEELLPRRSCVSRPALVHPGFLSFPLMRGLLDETRDFPSMREPCQPRVPLPSLNSFDGRLGG